MPLTAVIIGNTYFIYTQLLTLFSQHYAYLFKYIYGTGWKISDSKKNEAFFFIIATNLNEILRA